MVRGGLPETIGGKYRPREVLGEGAMGIVYSVEHMLTGEILALKVMTSQLGGSAEAIERFKREARASSKIRSQHVVRVLDADVAPELDGAFFLVMDLLDGSDLEQLSGAKPVERATVVEWLRQIALPLDKAHRIGIVHRDLKPENLFLTKRDDGGPLIKILDFGIAKIAAEPTGTTQSGQLLGTPLYMAPEQARGDAEKVGPRTDLYALGLIAYKLLTGSPYWTGTSVAAILGEILYEPLHAPSTRGHAFGPDFDFWFLRACQPDPAQRFTSAVEQIAALAAALGVPLGTASASTSSFGDQRESWVPEQASLQPEASGNALISLDGVPVDKNLETLLLQPSTFPPLAYLPTTGAKARWRGRRAAIVSAAALLSVVLILLYRRGSAERLVFAARPPAPSTESVVTLVATSMPILAPPAPTGSPAAEPSRSTASRLQPAEDPPRGGAPALPVSAAKRESDRSQPVRMSSALAASRREKSLLLDDALTDQK